MPSPYDEVFNSVVSGGATSGNPYDGVWEAIAPKQQSKKKAGDGTPVAGPWDDYKKQEKPIHGPWDDYKNLRPIEAKAGRDLSAELFPDGRPPGGRDMSAELFGNQTPMSRLDRFTRGLRDPIDGGAQLLTNMLPNGVVQAGNNLNNWLAEKTGFVATIPAGGMNQMQADSNRQYEEQRAASGNTGFDGYRVLGNIVNPANMIPGALAPKALTLAGRVAAGAGIGAVNAAASPVNGGDFWSEKGKQVATGAALGGVAPVVAGAVSRMISPNASTNPALELLKSEGVRPTIGQTLGGRWNALEEKLQSLPIMGDAISNARMRTLDQFNTAAINRASGKVGVNINESGQNGVRRAGDALSQAYDDALSQIKVVKFDQQFAQDLNQLRSMAQSLTPDMRNKFNQKLNDVIGGRMSGNGSMLGETYKKVDSEIGGLAAKFGKSSVASESELGDAFAQLQNLLKQQAMRTNPKAADALKAADAGWANLVRVEGAAKAGKNADGMFTPAQLNSAIQQADGSVRGRSMARGTALMQDLANAGQNVIGNKVPNSFTTDRALIAGGGLGAGFLNPVIPAGLLAGAAGYTPQIQSLLRGLVSSRPQSAEAIAEALRKASPGFGLVGGQVGLGLLN